MSTPDLFDRVIVFAVAQKPFDTPAEPGRFNTFCTLQPLLFEGGERTRPEMFPNNGLVWWKLHGLSRDDAVPGSLLGGYIEHAPQYIASDPGKQFYQVVPTEITPITTDDVVEICDVADRAVSSPRDLVNIPGVVELDHPPSDLVLVRWRGELYGPMATRVAASGDGAYRVSLTAAAKDGSVHRMPDPRGEPGHVLVRDVPIALDDRPPTRSAMTRGSNYELLTPGAADRVQERAVEKLILLRDDELITRAARLVLTRAKRQRLSELLGELKDAMGTHDAARTLGADDVVAALRRRVSVASPAVASLADALLETDAMRDPLMSAIDRTKEHWVEEHAAALRAEAEKQADAERAQLDALRRERQDLEADMAAQREHEVRETRAAIDAAWRAHQQRIDEDLARVAVERDRLEHQGRELSDRLGSIAARFGQEHDRLLGDLMLLLPVLQRSGGPVAARATAETPAADAPDSPAQQPLVLPPRVLSGAAADRPPPREDEFIDRFVDLATAAGHGYARDELLAFHVAQKSSDLVLVAGPPGSGRSALARLYALALAGETADMRWLSVPVEATWLDLSDVIGRVNPHARTFDPAPSGLFEWLIAAAAEHQRHADDAGISMLAFDGFDRASPEHWLALLLHLLDQPPGERTLRCFNPRAVRTDSALAPYHAVLLPPSLRITGVLHEDEEARPLGAALLDRAPLIRLAAAEPGEPADAEARGAAVTLGAYQRWLRAAPLSRTPRAIIDALRGATAALSPAAFRGISAFVRASLDVLDATTAIDMQLGTRIARLPLGFGERAGANASDLTRALEPWLEQLPRTHAALLAHEQLAEEEI